MTSPTDSSVVVETTEKGRGKVRARKAVVAAALARGETVPPVLPRLAGVPLDSYDNLAHRLQFP